MRFPGTKNLNTKQRELFTPLVATGVLMIAPAFMGWTQFRPNTAGIISRWYGAYVSSPLGLGTGPAKIGWILLVVSGVAFLVLGKTILKPQPTAPILRIAGMSVVLALYVALGSIQEVQINRWINDADGGNCPILGHTNCVPTSQFTSPSGRVLTVSDFSLGWGIGVGLLAVCCGIVTICWFSRSVEEMLDNRE